MRPILYQSHETAHDVIAKMKVLTDDRKLTSDGEGRESEFITRAEVEKLLAAQEESFSRRLAELSQRQKRWVLPGPRLTAVLICLLVVGVFFFCAWPGLFVGFDNDDVTNLERSWQEPLNKVVVANLVPFTTFYRPAGAAYYRICFALFGWRPEAFHFVTYGLLLANLLLIFLLARHLARSSEIGVLSALLYSFHGRLRQLYMSNGTVYDVLCTTLTLLTLLYYLQLREARKPTKWWQYVLLTACFIAAINAKEMAAIVPLLLLLYEWLYHPPDSLRPRALANWAGKNGRAAMVLLVLAMLAFWGKQQPGSLFIHQPLYAPSYTVRRYFENQRLMIAGLLYLNEKAMNTTKVLMFYGALFALAAASRKRHIWFAAWFYILAQLPVIFIPYRGLFAMYLPMAGFAVYLASVLVQIRGWLLRKAPDGAWDPQRLLTAALVVAVIPLGRNVDELSQLTILDPSIGYIAATHDDVMRLNEPLPPGAKVLLLKSRYPDFSWGPLMMMRLLYHDRNLILDRPGMMPKWPDESAISQYDRVIDFDGEKLLVVRKKAAAAAKHLNLPD